ncbi:oligogalacturonate-specific porin KdgM family protein [uncultured Psychromonas sp.]|uniref:oligogalacturonate-specific porin KdgM family protein n=1 Tax=uncultured Psychromonas sp. TaxID=173974 RepID=UPI0026307E4D|nr:oligogalacturonate-specific porin KdgM family protein [uncultured Psychromonas sp.]
MKLQNKLIFAVATTVLSSAAFAAQIDFRHEWKADNYEEASRIKLGTGFKFENVDNLKSNIGLEMKFKSFDKTKTLENTYLTETELDLGLTYKMGKWQIKPGMPIALTDRKRTFKPQIRIVYKSDFGLQTALRYRHEFANYSDPTDGDTNVETGKKVNRPTKSKVTLTGSYKIDDLPNLKLSYEVNYVKSWDKVRQFDGKDWEYDAGLVVGYQFGDWRPFAELWTVDESSSSSKRQARYRAGIKYKF